MAERKNLVFGLCMVLLSTSLIVQCFHYPLESALFPRFLAVILLLLSMVLLIRALRQSRKEGWKRPFLVISSRFFRSPSVQVFGVTAAYIALMSVLGFVVSTVIFIIASVSLLDRKKLKFAFLYGLCYPTILYVIFHFILRVTIPSGFLI